jgi:hypothetical protein
MVQALAQSSKVKNNLKTMIETKGTSIISSR